MQLSANIPHVVASVGKERGKDAGAVGSAWGLRVILARQASIDGAVWFHEVGVSREEGGLLRLAALVEHSAQLKGLVSVDEDWRSAHSSGWAEGR